MMVRNNIVGHHPVGAPTCLHKQEVGKPSLNAAQPHAKAEGCVHDDLRADKLRKGWGFRVGTWNIDSLTGRAGELVEDLVERKVDVACVQKTRWRDSGCRLFGPLGKRYKLFWMGSKAKTDGVRIFVAEKWVDSVVSVERHSEKALVLKMVLGDCLLNVFTVYAPHSGKPDEEKERFWNKVFHLVSCIPQNEMVVFAGDMNGHIGSSNVGYDGTHGGFGYGSRKAGSRILEFAYGLNLVICNTLFTKQESKLVTYVADQVKSTVDYIMVRQEDKAKVHNIKVISSEECVPKHKLLVMYIWFKATKSWHRKFETRVHVQKLKEEKTCEEYRCMVRDKTDDAKWKDLDVNKHWQQVKGIMIETSQDICGMTKGPCRHKETWWWNEEVAEAVRKRR